MTNRAFRPGKLYTLAFDTPVPLRAASGGPSGLFFDAVQLFTLIEIRRSRADRQWQATTTMYEYRLLDHRLTEQLVYHWQPGPDFAGPDHSHLHISAALDVHVDALNRCEIDLDKLHVPTGRISLERVIRMLISEFGIAPRRDDWHDALDRAEAVSWNEPAQRT